MARSKNLMVVAALLFAGACGGGDMTGADAGLRSDTGPSLIDGGPRPDTGPRPDSGGGGDDECEAGNDDAASSVGCNGGFLDTEPAPNGPLGTCTVDSDGGAAGSCTDANAICDAAEGAPTGTCLVLCPIADTYVSTGDCPTGFRCFSFEEYGLCYRDCDDTHACPTGYECDGEGSCISGGPPPVDGGTPTGDGGAGSDGGGLTLPDASVTLPDASVTLDGGAG